MNDRWHPARLTSTDAPGWRFALPVLVLYAALTTFVTAHHEPWRDEADAWLVVRDASLGQMIPHWTSDAGTPALWYAALTPVVKMGLPYGAENGLNLLFALAAATVLVLRAPFTRTSKVLILCSYFFSYEYPVVARSYALSILLLFLAAAAYPRRQEHPLRYAIPLALAANANVHAALIVLAALLPYLLDRPARRWAGFWTITAGLAISFAQLAFPSGPSPHPIGGDVRLEAVPSALRQAFFTGLPGGWAWFLSIVLLVALALALRSRRDALFVLIAGTGGLLTLFTVVIFGGLRHSGLVLVATLFAIWLAGDVPGTWPSRAAAALLNIGLLASIASAATMARSDVRFAFSGSKEMAGFIRGRQLDRLPIAAHNLYTAEALLPYLPGKHFWYAGLGEYGTYMKWDLAQEKAVAVPYAEAMRRARAHFDPTRKPWLLLLNTEMPQPETYGFTLLHKTSVAVFRRVDESYWLYAPVGGGTAP
jgi:hypothetical protein